MANYEAMVRSNYFRVKNESAFRMEIDRMAYIEVRTDDTEAELLMICRYDGDSLPGWYDMDEYGSYYDDEPPEIDWVDFFSRHLEDEEVAIIMEVGHEKLRYLTGVATAYNNKGETEYVSLGLIYELALKLGKYVTEAEY